MPSPRERSLPTRQAKAEALRLARRRFAGLLGPQIELREGVQSIALLSGRHVIVIPKQPNLVEAAREAALLRTMGGRVGGVAVPHLLDHDATSGALAMTRLPGQPLRDQIPSLSRAELTHIGNRLGAFLRGFHGLSRGTDWIAAECSRFGTSPHCEAFRGQRRVWAHHDLHSENVLYDRNSGEVGVIDFTGSGAGWAEEDFFKLDCFPTAVQTACFSAYNRKKEVPVQTRTIRDYALARDAQATRNGTQIDPTFWIPPCDPLFARITA
ncbi:MAG: phosphotransferase [Pseudomonadota bacterium]